jgi:hypothetical protein
MTTMPHWLNKTPEMVAMDRWFSAGPELVERYNDAITSIEAPPGNAPPGQSRAIASMGTQKVQEAFFHFQTDWLNPNNPASGGNFWPHVPTLNIKIWLKQGLLNAMHKGLGRHALGNLKNPAEIAAIFESEIEEAGIPEAELDGPMPLVTTWVCTAPAGTGSIEVDAVRGPTVVELILATPFPKTAQARIWAEVRDLIDVEWNNLHLPAPPVA